MESVKSHKTGIAHRGHAKTGSTAVGLITPMLCPVLVLAWALQVVVVPGQTRAVMGGDPERSRAIELIKGRILADLGLSSAPSGAPSEAQGTLSKAHLDHMMRVYRRSVQRSVEPGPGERVRNDRKEFARGNEREVMHYYSFKNQGESSGSLCLRDAKHGTS
ncbi:hypothetical protein IscW_ISCW020647 [Ixodes scapularis]|uniref:Uncharacterized protein n=1 Tax=Ixodes scapularis TaxID=6945 RepID=B7Q2P0_IXOSC|nr:hypothetical protein IscW_ISCW020647 [Ixodes scapularis]|eukprot:XP_002410920.1 hypothetical protein IscW_ISCW020647 [Ixodes scapularis]